MKTWWATRTSREQRFLMTGGIFLAALLIIYLIVLPIHHKINTLSEKLDQNKQMLAWMQSSLPSLKTLRAQNPSSQKKQNIPAGSLLSSIENSLKQSSLSKQLSTLEKEPSETAESVSLKFDHVNFDELIHWLIQFSNNYNMTIDQFSATKTQESGIVQANLVIVRM